MAETEPYIIEGLRRQSPKAQQQLLAQYGNHVWAQVVRIVSNVENAEEVYQDVFVKAFNNITMYDASKSSLKTWLSRIAYNEAVSMLRRKRQPTIYFEDHTGEVLAISEAEVEETLGHPSEETVQLIRAALKLLPPDEQAIIMMFYYDELSLKEIAYIMESIPSTVASKLSRTRRKICRIINKLRS